MLRTLAIHFGALAVLFMAAAQAAGQAPTPTQTPDERTAALARRGGGLRVAAWHTEAIAAAGATYVRSPAFEAYFQRGLDKHISLESSAGIWRRRSVVPQAIDGPVITKTYVVPIISSLKIYPFTTSKVLLEPFLLGGGGFAIGIDDVSTNAVGGGGKSTSAGFGFKAAAGLEIHATRILGLTVAWRYESVKFGDRVGDQQAYSGSGLEGGLTYRPRE